MSLPITEQENPRTREIDKLSTIEALRLINEEDKKIALAVEKVLPEIALVIDTIIERLRNNGQLFYVGTGTSGRLGVLDASECPPTFGVSPELVQGVIAGGYEALYKAVEVSEDDQAAGARDLKHRGITPLDALIGIAASGNTPYTIGALEYAKSIGCFTAALACNPNSKIVKIADISPVPVVGPEVIAGSTRMKAGTSHKMILNMISTEIMIRLGYVSGNRMTNVQPRNEKLKQRSLRILMAETGLEAEAAVALMQQANNDLRIALVMQRTDVSREKAEEALRENQFIVENAIKSVS